MALALSVALSFLAYGLTRSQLLNEREGSLVSQAYLNARVARSALRASDPDVPALLGSLETNASSVVMLRLEDEWFSGSVAAGPDDVPSSLLDVVRSGSAAWQRVGLHDGPHLAMGVPVPAVDALYFELAPLTELDATLDALARGLALAAGVTTLAGSAVGVYASGRVLQPLRRMAGTAAGIAGGTTDARLDAEGDVDLEPLVASFNEMVDALQARIEREARFASDVSHELRSPLAAMASTVAVARRHGHDSDAVDEALVVLDDHVQAFQQVVLDLLEISRVESGVAVLQLDQVDPGRLAAAVLEALDHPEIELVVKASAPPLVHLDKRRVGQMLTNLMHNAERYAGGATRLVVSGDEGALRFGVEDNGPGVAEHERSYVFERFARGEASLGSTSSGTGLGLALVAEHARLHGGEAWVEEADGGGARFLIELPVPL